MKQTSEELKKKEAILTAALATPKGLAKIAEVIRSYMVGEWRKSTNGLTCYKCNSLNIEIQLGLLEHWSGLRKRCLDCGHHSHGVQAINRGYIIVEKPT